MITITWVCYWGNGEDYTNYFWPKESTAIDTEIKTELNLETIIAIIKGEENNGFCTNPPNMHGAKRLF